MFVVSPICISYSVYFGRCGCGCLCGGVRVVFCVVCVVFVLGCLVLWCVYVRVWCCLLLTVDVVALFVVVLFGVVFAVW